MLLQLFDSHPPPFPLVIETRPDDEFRSHAAQSTCVINDLLRHEAILRMFYTMVRNSAITGIYSPRCAKVTRHARRYLQQPAV